MQRENFGSRLGFILISAGCAIGLGNVWRFPYIVGEYGGAAFILIYLAFLVMFGLPILSMEFAVGRASQKSIARSHHVLEPKGTKWHWAGWMGIAGNYIIMMFYTTVSGWMLAYLFKMMKGDFVISPETMSQYEANVAAMGAENVPHPINSQFDELLANPTVLIIFMVIVVVSGFLICSLGLKQGVERITKVMMIALFVMITAMAIRSITLPGAEKGLRYYLVPDFKRMTEHSIGEVLFAALGQSFFTLSIGIGSMAIFGSYIKRDRRLFGESVSVAVLDTLVAFIAGLIIIPACSAFNIEYGQGPSLIFVTLPNVFNSMPGGRLWGSLFFLFMLFAAMSTVIGVFENIISFAMDIKGWSRTKACVINTVVIIILSLPCALGFNVLSFIHPLGEGSVILDLEDFIVSNNLLPIGSLIYVLFCTWNKKGWGWDNFIKEVNTGKGMRFSPKLYFYAKYIMPVILVIILAQGYISKFFPDAWTNLATWLGNIF